MSEYLVAYALSILSWFGCCINHRKPPVPKHILDYNSDLEWEGEDFEVNIPYADIVPHEPICPDDPEFGAYRRRLGPV